MHIEKNSWLSAARMVARKFIESNYSEEAPLFDAFWQAFSFKINEAFKAGTSGPLTLKQTSQTITEISIAKGYALDLMTPVIIGTITEIMYEMRTRRLSANELERLIGSAAARQGAKPSLTACLIRHLPQLYNELSSCKENVSEAVVSSVPVSRYRIWTAGTSKVVENLDKYEKHKDDYLLWIDIDEKQHVSHRYPRQKLKPMAVKLFRYLVDNFDKPVYLNDILRDVFEEPTIDDFEEDKVFKVKKETLAQDLVEQYLTSIEKFSGNQFRKHLSSRWKQNGLSLRGTFANKYFLFERLR